MLWRRDERWVWARLHGAFYGIIGQHQGWVRLWGWGISWHSSVIPPRFSERYGFVRTLKIGPWSLEWLRRARR